MRNDVDLWLETRRNAFHLFFGSVLAFLVLYLGKKSSLIFFGSTLLLGLLISRVMTRKEKLPLLGWFIEKFERKNVAPGTGVINFLLGAFISVSLFEPYYVFVGLLILSYLDSFSTVVGLSFGRHRIWRKKTLEGSLGGFIASFLVASIFIPIDIAALACFIAMFIELFSFIDDNIFIPIVSSSILWLFRV